MAIKYEVGDIVKTKKPHPCGSDLWEVTRTGIDFGMKCQKCGRYVLVPRPKFEKAVKTVIGKKDNMRQGTAGNQSTP